MFFVSLFVNSKPILNSFCSTGELNGILIPFMVQVINLTVRSSYWGKVKKRKSNLMRSEFMVNSIGTEHTHTLVQIDLSTTSLFGSSVRNPLWLFMFPFTHMHLFMSS